jgi:hypothetical protein
MPPNPGGIRSQDPQLQSRSQKHFLQEKFILLPHNRVARWHIFKPKNANLGKILEGLAMQDFGIFYGHWTILWQFGKFWSILWLFGMVI